ncbi:MAG: PAS domain-containing protein [Isosphaeraceae bacterium]
MAPDAQSVLDALDAHIAVLDLAGRITAVNRAWRRFSRENGGDDGTTGIGMNYLEVCRSAEDQGHRDACATAQGLRAVLRGEMPEFRLEYPCHSPTEQRWFLLHVTPLDEGGAVTSHLTITDRKLAEQEVVRGAAELAESYGRLRRLADDLDRMASSRAEACERLERALKDLQRAEAQLVHSEKMSAAGATGRRHRPREPTTPWRSWARTWPC